MTPEQQWDGPIQDAIREHDRGLGHLPKAPAAGGHHVTFFHPPNRPTGGTVFVRPDSGNPYACIDEDPRSVVVVELPAFEEEAP
jgi:hypothetical protein